MSGSIFLSRVCEPWLLLYFWFSTLRLSLELFLMQVRPELLASGAHGETGRNASCTDLRIAATFDHGDVVLAVLSPVQNMFSLLGVDVYSMASFSSPSTCFWP